MRNVPIEEVESIPILWLSAWLIGRALWVAQRVNLGTEKVIEALNKKGSNVIGEIKRRGL